MPSVLWCVDNGRAQRGANGLRRGGMAMAMTLALAGAAVLGGCYRHVVKASGPGSDRTPLYQPNVADPDDRAPTKKTVPSKTVPTKKAD